MRFPSLIIAFLLSLLTAHAQVHDGQNGNIDENWNGEQNRNFNPHNSDTTKKNKEVPKGVYVWTVDRKFGEITKAEVDTLPHLYPQSTLGMGRYGQYNTIGSNYSARQNRIFIDRKEKGEFLFTDAYDQTMKQPDQLHFTNTLSPITNLSYDNCGDKTDGEDHFDARFAANFNKRIGIGLDLDYSYARGYFQNQSTSDFGATLFGSYLGDKYQMHVIFNTHHQKAAENGGIASDAYITHPEQFSQTYANNEIPTYLVLNWNRNDIMRLFLTHRYSLGFYKKVKMTEEEIKARKFAEQAKAEKEKAENAGKDEADTSLPAREAPKGRPDGAKIMGDAPTLPSDSLSTASTRIKVDSKEMADSLLAEQAKADSIEATMKKVFVPVTSFIHTIEVNSYKHIYQAYSAGSINYLDYFYDNMNDAYTGDSIYDQTKLFNVRNTVALALLEGFNKYVPAGLKAFLTHDLRRYDMPDVDDAGVASLKRWKEHNVSIGGQLLRTQGKTFHYNVMAETWLVGEDAGQLKVQGESNLNFPLFKDTVRLEAKAHFYRLNPDFAYRHYHSKHLWWDNDLSKEMRTRIEGTFSYDKTKTSLRIAIEEIQNYTYLGLDYTYQGMAKSLYTAVVKQQSSNINVLTAQLKQDFKLGPLNWDNILTYQSSSDQGALPLPKLNVFTNLYLKFNIARVLRVELGASATWFTKYKAPDFCFLLNQFAVQENEASQLELGNFPFVDVYANLHLKHARFFIMMTNAFGKSLNRQVFLAPHYPQNRSVLHLGVSWNFFN